MISSVQTSLSDTRKKRSASGAARAARRVVGRALPLTAALCGLLGLWYLLTSTLNVPEYLLPTPGEVADSFSSNVPLLWDSLKITGHEVGIGFLFSLVVAIPLGIALGESRILQRFAVPLIVISQVVPKAALAPLMIVWFGIGLSSKILFIALMCFFPVVINTMTGVAAASADFRKLARSVGLRRLATLRKVTIPQALPSIFAGLKISMTLSVIGAVVAEFVAAQAGLGYVILAAQGQLRTDLLFATVFVLTVMGLVLYEFVVLCEWIAVPWARKGEEQ